MISMKGFSKNFSNFFFFLKNRTFLKSVDVQDYCQNYGFNQWHTRLIASYALIILLLLLLLLLLLSLNTMKLVSL